MHLGWVGKIRVWCALTNRSIVQCTELIKGIWIAHFHRFPPQSFDFPSFPPQSRKGEGEGTSGNRTRRVHGDLSLSPSFSSLSRTDVLQSNNWRDSSSNNTCYEIRKKNFCEFQFSCDRAIDNEGRFGFLLFFSWVWTCSRNKVKMHGDEEGVCMRCCCIWLCPQCNCSMPPFL